MEDDLNIRNPGQPLKVAALAYDLQPRCVVGELRDAETGKLLVTVQGTTYGDTRPKADAQAFALGYRIAA